MLEFSNPITSVPKIGSKYKTRLEKLEIKTVGDLIYHFPFRYDDYSKTKPISQLEEGDTLTVTGTLEKIDNIYTRNRKKITKAKISDKTSTVDAIWFNQHFIKRQLKVGETYNFSGKVKKFNYTLNLVAPIFEKEGAKTLNTSKLVPVYPETVGVTSKWLRSRINDVLNMLAVPEFLPEPILKKYNLMEIEKALRTFHFPKTLHAVETAKERFSLEELFLELLKVEYRKYQWGKEKTGPWKQKKSSPYGKQVNGLVKTLPFTLTPSQKTAVYEILEDMNQTQPMNRLLEGDVGTGKTIVAIIAAYLCHLNGFGVLYMAPTEILAKQHFKTFQKFLDGLDIKIELVVGKGNPARTSHISPHILIGTHALLYTQKTLPKTGLIIIDEQHRFGVEQRAEIVEKVKKATTPHVLTMTATPIPRTLALTLYGDLSISTLDTPPNKEKKITTRVVPEDMRKKAYKWIKNKNQSTFVVCPFIEESNFAEFENVKAATAEFEKLKKGPFEGVPIGLLHGKLKSKEKQEVIEKFRAGKIRVLVSTPVIEVGIDIPKASVMVIESAERYGLASLHQLRGRVGRGAKEGFCFVFMSNNSRQGYKRLKYLETMDKGIDLAEIDMKMRGHGDIYGTMQHGFRKFKVADIQDLELLEKAKKEAQHWYPKLDEYPLLKTQLEYYGGRLVADN